MKSPEHVHTYGLTQLSISNAWAAGLAAEQMVAAMREHAGYAVSPNVEREIIEPVAHGVARATADFDVLAVDPVTLDESLWIGIRASGIGRRGGCTTG